LELGPVYRIFMLPFKVIFVGGECIVHSGKGGWGCGRDGVLTGRHTALEWSLSVYNHITLNAFGSLEKTVGKVRFVQCHCLCVLSGCPALSR
jgi:hypothetical protein